MLERAVFKVDTDNQTTIFDEYNERLSNMNIFLHQEI